MFYLFKKRNPQKGFTLIEMLVVVAIFLITTGIVLSNFKGFTRKSSLDLLVREMALVIRQAQVYGTATRRYEGELQHPDDKKFPSYGVYIKGEIEKGTNKPSYFMVFADKNDNGEHDNNINSDICNPVEEGASKECVEQFNLYGGAIVASVKGCWFGSGGSEDDSNPGYEDYTCESINKKTDPADDPEGLNIVFTRPSPGASFAADCTGNCPENAYKYSYAKITVKDSATSDTRDIYVWKTGHIYVQSELGD